MSYPIKQTNTSVLRLSIADERKRQEKVAKDIYNADNIDKYRKKSSGINGNRPDSSAGLNIQSNSNLQKKSGIDQGGYSKFRGIEHPDSPEHIAGRVTQQSSGARPKDTASKTKQVPKTQTWYTDARVGGYSQISSFERNEFSKNLSFYRNNIFSRPPPGHKIEDMLKWKKDYDMLERNHRYIQWLFPIPEGNGLNISAQQLYEHEAEAIRDDDKTRNRVLRAFEMMLDFYGMQLVDDVHGRIKRSDKGWEQRYEHLNRSRHNYLRITRILKSLGELGFERFQAPWVEFLIDEAVINKELPNLNGGCLMHWISAVKNDAEKEILFRKASGLPINYDSDIYGVDSESDDEEGASNEKETHEEDLDKANKDLSNLNLEPSDDGKVTVESAKVKVNKQASSVQRDENEKKDKEDIENKEAAQASAKNESMRARSEQENQVYEGPCDNIRFYQNKLHSKPSPGYVIETILKSKGHYEFLEGYPFFIHWLFPTPQESESNPEAQPLQPYEAEFIRNDDKLRSLVLQAYKMTLDFFGMELIDENSGWIGRNPDTYKKRYKYLDKNRHNFHGVRRILVSLGELGFERYQVPLIEFFIEEAITCNKLKTLTGTFIMLWIDSLKDEQEKGGMFEKYLKYKDYNADISSDEEIDYMKGKKTYQDVYDPSRYTDNPYPSEALNYFAAESMNF
ncbi:uncharacterized protein LOC132719761 isoform X2 [Ruditapes philippinarum]|uniref:uncharacterized protein LOC132719761 isoform X2 n=1 Tax=Ruditapes philippinarum TaxID=129788 RepID=UPI00295C1EC7|nr:uncharacterized protein LOC132719761 isoform X2 [Ruditapes philippinarum]